jgi:hypothetical protein
MRNFQSIIIGIVTARSNSSWSSSRIHGESEWIFDYYNKFLWRIIRVLYKIAGGVSMMEMTTNNYRNQPLCNNYCWGVVLFIAASTILALDSRRGKRSVSIARDPEKVGADIRVFPSSDPSLGTTSQSISIMM